MIMWFIISLILGLAIGGLVYIVGKFIYDDLHTEYVDKNGCPYSAYPDNKEVIDNEKSQE